MIQEALVAQLPPGTTIDEHGRPLDQIRLVGITQHGYHGVLDFERVEGQPFIADVTVHLDTRRAAASDDLSLTINYGILAEQVAQILSAAPVNLIETVAEQIAATVLDYAGVGAVDVYLHKPKAPISVPFDDVVVAIRRDRVKLPAARYEPPIQTVSAPTPEVAPMTTAASCVLPVPPPPTEATAAAVGSAAAPTVDPVPGPAAPDRMDVAPPGLVRAVLALGANQGTPTATLRAAILDLDASSGIQVRAVAPLARTAAVGGPEQDDYFNTVILIETDLAPRALLTVAQRIEHQHGRVREVHWGPRTLDIDLIDYDGLVAVADDLELPHPRAHERAFVLQPWTQIEPGANLPGLGGGPVDALAATAPDAAGIRWFALDWLETEKSEDTAQTEQAAQAARTPAEQAGTPVRPDDAH